MKQTILFLLISLLLSSSVGAQQTDSLTLKVGRVYAGVFAQGAFDKKVNFSNASNIMVGSEAELIFNPQLSFKARTAYTSSNGAITHLYFLGKSESGDLLMGFMPRSCPLLLRPNPVSAEGQAEFLTMAIIPGAAAGAMFKTGGLNLGVFNAGDKPEYNAGFQDSLFGGDFCAAGFVNENYIGLGVSRTDRNFSWTIFGLRSNFATHLEFKQSNGGIFYGDVVTADLNFQKAQSWEIGWRREFNTRFQNQSFKILIGFGAGHVGPNNVRAYVLMHI